MIDKSTIQPKMPVVGLNDATFATVDHVEGEVLKLRRDKQGTHHYIPLSWVTSVDDKVHVDRPVGEIQKMWTTEPPRM